MKVLHLIDHFGNGGAQVVVRDIVANNKDHLILALSKKENEFKVPKNVSERLNILNFKGKWNIKEITAINRHIKENNIDVIDIHLKKALLDTFLFKLFFRTKVKIVIHEHGPINSPKKSYARILRLLSPKISTVIAVSNSTADRLHAIAKIPKNKIEILRNFIDFENMELLDEKEKEELRKSIGITKENFTIGFSGRLHPLKRLDTVINAVKSIEDENIRLLILGDGQQKEELEILAGNDKRIIFLGFRNDAKKLYQLMNATILASNTEASPIMCFESMTYGLPLIGSDIDGIKELVKDNETGLIFKVGDEKDLVKKITLLKNNKSLQSKIKENALKEAKKYDIKEYNKKLKEIYEK